VESKIEYLDLAWHSLDVDDILLKLKTNKTLGLSQVEASERLKQFGTNTLTEPKRRSLFSIVFHQLLSPLIYLLFVAAGIAYFIGELRDAIVILIVILLNTIVGAYQEGRAEVSLAALRRLTKSKTKILRDQREQIIETSEIVRGDILILNSGDSVVADARLFNTSSFAVAEAALTGEASPVIKSTKALQAETILADRNNMVYAGTQITAGRALGIVIATGKNNEIGKIAELSTTTKEPKTQLELRISQFGKYLMVIAVVVFFLVIVIGLLRGIPFVQILMISISQMVSLVPEGLPVAMTVALAVGVQRMARRGTIVRRLGAVESLGSTNIICTDKTGTLTRNEMTVTSLYLPANKREIIVTGVGYNPEGELLENKIHLDANNDKNLNQLLLAGILCNDALLIKPDETDSRWHILGDPTEGALLTLAIKGGLDPNTIRKKYLRKAELPFNSTIRMMATEHEINNQSIVYIKGAPEKLLEFCTNIYDEDQIKILDNNTKLEIQNVESKMANSALRLLALGYIVDAKIDHSQSFSAFHGKVIFLGLVGELDPPRDEVAVSIQQCHTAGIKIVMVTGDHKATGVAIAKVLGIGKKNDLALDGLELDKLTEQEFLEKIDNISVFARVQPAQKLRIVEAYQKKGNIVTVTGDGVNDAPALMRANVGVAMGITGTDVAKEAAKIIITDDNFKTIVVSIAEGRLVYQNIKKLILFLFVTSIDEVLILFLALILGFSPPFAAVQILWINLVTEGTLTINLIMEPAEGDEMSRSPIDRKQPLLDKALLSRIPLMVFTSVTSTFGWFAYRSSLGISPAIVQTETFTILVVCQWFNVLNCRSNNQSVFTWDLLKNPWLLGGLVLAICLQVAVIYWQPLGRFFHTVPIDLFQLITIGSIASSTLWAEELRKYIVRKGICKNEFQKLNHGTKLVA
jgi:Ca2+-transporting ATPase